MRLIDADRLKSMYSINQGNFNTVVGIQKWIDNAPTIQAVPIEVLEKIRAEIEKPLHDERCYDTENAKAQYIALNWVLEIIDKYRKEQE